MSLNVLRENRFLLMSILETFLHDPLCEWGKHKGQPSKAPQQDHGEQESLKAVKILGNIDRKLQGFAVPTGLSLSVQGQVQELISSATDAKNLSAMYFGWAPYL